MPGKIGREIAEGMHTHFMQDVSPGTEDVKGVFYPFTAFIAAFNEAYKEKGVKLPIDLPGLGFYCYFARYVTPNPHEDTNTIIVAFADQDPQYPHDPTKLIILNTSIYDFGDPCPRNCATNKFP